MSILRILLGTTLLAAALSGVAAADPAPPPPRPPSPVELLPRYDLDIRLDVSGHKALVHQRVTWTNRTHRPTAEIVFNAHSRYIPPESEIGLFAKTLEILRMNASEGLYGLKRPLEVTRALVGGKEMPFRFAGDTQTDLVVPLPAPLGPNETVTLDLEFTFHLPQKQGRWGQWEGVTFLSNWVPVVAFYDESGWQPTPFVPWHQPFFNESGNYTVRVTLPAEEKVACSGRVVKTTDLEGGLQQVDIVAPGVRDFAFLCSARYKEFTAEAETLPGHPKVRLHCLAFPEHEHYAEYMLRVVSEVIPYYSRWFGAYPWPDFTIAESYFGWNGNECATLVMIDERVFGMPHVGEGYVEYLISHETCHQWWYNLIGTNGYRETWMDEAMATFFAHKFLNQRNGCNSGMIRYPAGLEWLPNISRESYRLSTMYGVLGRGEETPIVQELPKFGHIGNLFGMCYDKGSKVVGMIEERIGGEEEFRRFMLRIRERYDFRILRVADFQRELQEYTGPGRNWEEFFQRWLYSAGMCDWSVEKVKIERCSAEFPDALHGKAGQRYKVTVLLHQKGDYDEPTTLGICVTDPKEDEDGHIPFQIRIPITPQIPVADYPDPKAHVETLPDHRVRVEVELACEPTQIAVDPDGILADRDPANNYWKPRVRWRFSPIFTLLDESDLTVDYDRWNVTAGPWLNGAAYSDPWYTRSTILGVRLGAYRTAQFVGGVYVGYRPDFGDVVAGVDGQWDHWPLPRTQIGFNVETRLTTLSTGEAHPDRAVLWGRYVFQYNSSLYLPPIHYLEAFVDSQDNFLPLVRRMVPGGERWNSATVGGLHYHLNYLTPYWDPQGGLALDLTYTGGVADLDRRVATNQLVGQFSTVKSLPDFSGTFDEETLPGKFLEPTLRWLADTRIAVRAYGAGGLPDRGEFFALGGSDLFRALSPAALQGSVVWIGSVEWRFPLARQIKYDMVDHVIGVRNLYGAAFYEVGDAYTNGRAPGPTPEGVGLGLRLDVTWFGFVERTTLRLDVAKAVNLNTPIQISLGANMPF